MTLTYEQKVYQWASGHYLADYVPNSFFKMSDKDQLEYLQDNAWQPFEDYQPEDIHQYIWSLANDVIMKEVPVESTEVNIQSYLQDEIKSLKEVIAEYTSNDRPKCTDGSDDFIEGKLDLAEKLLAKIEEDFEGQISNDCPTWEELAETGMSPKMIEATLNEYKK